MNLERLFNKFSDIKVKSYEPSGPLLPELIPVSDSKTRHKVFCVHEKKNYHINIAS